MESVCRVPRQTPATAGSHGSVGMTAWQWIREEGGDSWDESNSSGDRRALTSDCTEANGAGSFIPRFSAFITKGRGLSLTIL
jgi:hypothetical protein